MAGGAARVVEKFRQGHRLVYALLVFVACAAVHYAVLEAFLGIPLFNTDTQVRPASGLSPVLGLFFGVPGILGCAVGNLLSDMSSQSDPGMLFIYLLVQIAYNAVPYVVWYVLYRKRAFPFPRLDSSGKVASYLVIMAIDAVLVAFLLMPLEVDTLPTLDINIIRALNNIVFLIYVGIPVLFALEFSPLVPLYPRFVRTEYHKRERVNMTQRFVMLFTFMTAGVVILFITFGYAPYFVEGDPDFGGLIASIYVMVAALTAITFAPMLLLLHYMETRFTRPLEVLTEASGTFVDQVEGHQIGAGELRVDNVPETGIKPRLEMRDLFDSTNKMRSDIARYVDRLAVVTAERERTAAELDIARQIQMGAVPHEFSSFRERYRLEVDALMRPAREVGGDFYDVFDVGEGKVGFVIGDVSGKGVPASLFMMRAQSLVKEHMLASNNMGTALTLANRRLCERNDAMLFVTVFACVLDTSTGRVEYANAGHNPPSVLREGVRQFLHVKPGLVLGALDTVTYDAGTIDLMPGDGFVLYTDGVTEAADADEQMFGEERLAQVLAACDADGRSVLACTVANVDAFAGDTPQADDITLLSFTWSMPVVRLVLEPEDERLDDLFDFLRPLCKGEGRTSKMLHGLMLVCEEAFVNICHYGFPDGQPRLPVLVEAAVDERNGLLHLAISDRGVAYNPLSYEVEKVGLGKDHRVGGLGILLMREYVDELRYERSDGQNILRMTKSFV